MLLFKQHSAVLVVLILASCAVDGCSDSDQSPPTPTASTAAPKSSNFSKLTIGNISYANGVVDTKGTTDLPDGTNLSGYLDVAGRPDSDIAIGADATAIVQSGKYSMQFAVPKRPEFSSGRYDIEIGCYSREQSSGLEQLFGENGQHFTGPHAEEDQGLGITSLETHKSFSVDHPPPTSYAMVSPYSFPKDTPQRAFAYFMRGWQREDWAGMVKYTQKTWQQDTPNPADSLSNDFGFEQLLGDVVIDTQPDGDCHEIITSKVTVALGSHIKTGTMETNVICEAGPYTPSLKGQWGVVPIMRTP